MYFGNYKPSCILGQVGWSRFLLRAEEAAQTFGAQGFLSSPHWFWSFRHKFKYVFKDGNFTSTSFSQDDRLSEHKLSEHFGGCA